MVNGNKKIKNKLDYIPSKLKIGFCRKGGIEYYLIIGNQFDIVDFHEKEIGVDWQEINTPFLINLLKEFIDDQRNYILLAHMYPDKEELKEFAKSILEPLGLKYKIFKKSYGIFKKKYQNFLIIYNIRKKELISQIFTFKRSDADIVNHYIEIFVPLSAKKLPQEIFESDFNIEKELGSTLKCWIKINDLYEVEIYHYKYSLKEIDEKVRTLAKKFNIELEYM